MLKLQFSKFFFIFSATILSSCAINYNIPDNRFMTSETTGALGKVEMFAGVGNGKNIELTPDYSTTWVNPQKPYLESSSFATAGAFIGLHEKIDVGARYDRDVGFILNGKTQLLGKRGEQGFQLALAGQVGGGSEEMSENNSTPTRADLKNHLAGLDLIFGVRTGSSLLFYSSVFYDHTTYKVNQTHGTTAQTFKGKANNTGANLGLKFDLSQNANILLEFARAKVESGDSRLTTSSFGGILAFLF